MPIFQGACKVLNLATQWESTPCLSLHESIPMLEQRDSLNLMRDQ